MSTGAGPSGLRPQHLRDALVPGLADEFSRKLTDVLNILVKGDTPNGIRPWICGASLMALRKDSGDHRPVAVGETLRRLAAKVLLCSYKNTLREYLEPCQVGVGTRGGCEAVVHTCRQWIARNKQDNRKILVKVDISNAFNCVDRSAVLQAVRRVAPELTPFVDFCYKEQSS